MANKLEPMTGGGIEVKKLIKRAIASGDYRGYEKAQRVLKVPVCCVLLDRTGSMLDDPIALQLAGLLESYGALVLGFGDGEHEEPIACSISEIEGKAEGAGDGAETPFAALATALIFLGRPLSRLRDYKSIFELLLGKRFDQNNTIHIKYSGNGVNIIGDSNFPCGHINLDKTITLSQAEETFTPRLGEKGEEEDVKFMKERVKNEAPIHIFIITDEYPGILLSPGLIQILNELGFNSEYQNKYLLTVKDCMRDLSIDELAEELRRLGIYLHFITPFINRKNKYYYDFGMEKLGLFSKALAKFFGGTYTELPEELKKIDSGSGLDEFLRLMPEIPETYRMLEETLKGLLTEPKQS